MLFTRVPENATDIREFCRQFNENVRVEYKRNFDPSVRNALPKIVSSFANSLGGVLVIGVVARDGVPVEPIEGFDQPQEEIPLTIENICLQNLNPPILPTIIHVPSDIPGKVFTVVEVSESDEAPHAIENSTKVYVRTGASANPYELAKVEGILELVARRQEPQSLRNRQMARQVGRADELVPVADEMTIEVRIGPARPRRPVIERERLWEFMNNQTFRGGRFVPTPMLRRTSQGIAAVDRGEYCDITEFGFHFWRKPVGRVRMPVEEFRPGQGIAVYRRNFHDVLQLLLKSVVCATRLVDTIGYRGTLEIDARIVNCLEQSMPFLAVSDWPDLDHFRCVERVVESRITVEAENLGPMIVDSLIRVLCQLCWPFWQFLGEFPEQAFSQDLREKIQRLGLI